MTDLDTAAIRSIHTCDPLDTAAIREGDRTILDLCTALDAARADNEVSDQRRLFHMVRAEVAEARIAAALAICDRRDAPGPVLSDHDDETELFRRTLTGGTQ